MAGEHRGREDRGGGGPGDDLALVVDEDDAIGVAVEREPDRRVLGEHRPPEIGEVVERHDVGRVVREGAVELAVEHREVERQAVEHRGHDHSTHTVGGVGDDAHRHQRVDVDEGSDVRGERRQQVGVLDATGVFGPLEQPARDHGLDLGQPGFLTDRRRAARGRA